MKSKFVAPLVLASAGVCFLFFQIEIASSFGFLAIDPGVRVGPSGVGGPIAGLSDSEGKFFEAGLGDFAEPDGTSEGLGPRMNLDSCSGCHLQPEVGGTSPFVNPQVAFANKMNATNTVPSFITANGPVREARFVRNPDGTPDGGVHALFTITGRDDAPGCVLGQPAFEQELANRNVIFRIPTPTYGAGLIEEIPDSAIVANRVANASTKRLFGISGRVNRNGNDGTLTRFGWKAQNKSLLLFSGEAYNVEMGITNELFQTERDET
ncbi:MAG: thiol oxidoreductase, partial [Chloroflexi bacterium]